MLNNSAFGGGGYITSPGNVASPSQNRSPSKRSESNSKNGMPCTIAQLESIPLTEDSIKIGNVEASEFIIVGRVRDFEVATTNTNYTVDDYTGELAIKKWTDPVDDKDDSTKEVNNIEKGQYVKIYGQLKAMQGKRFVMALDITPLKSLNQLSIHMMEVVQARAVAEAWQKKESVSSLANQPADLDTGMGMAGFHGNMMDNLNGLDNVQKSVHSVIKAVPNEDGCSIDHIFQTLNRTSKSAIRDALEFLSSEGHIYPTMDDDHFKTT